MPLGALRLGLMQWAWVGVGVVVVAVLGLMLWQRAQLAECKKAQVEIRAAYDLLTAKVEEQNAQIIVLEQASKDAQAKATKALADARRRSAVHTSRADKADAAIRQPVQPADCPAAAGVAEARALLRGGK